MYEDNRTYIRLMFKVIAYYKLYILLIPFAIFWFSYVGFLFKVFWHRFIIRELKCVFLPDWLESNFLNITVVLPKRMCFKAIYYFNLINFKSLRMYRRIALILAIVFIIGLPFISLYLLYLLILDSDLKKALEKISKNENIKLIILNKSIFRNMKKGYSSFKNNLDVFKEADKITEKGLYPIFKEDRVVFHAVAFDKDFGIGSTVSSKKQKLNKLMSVGEGRITSEAYIQKFEDLKGFIPLEEVTNPKLSSILNDDALHFTILSNKKVSMGEVDEIVTNRDNLQEDTRIDFKDITKSKMYIDYCGGIDKVNDTLEYIDFINKLVDEANMMIIQMINAKKLNMPSHFELNKDLYYNLKNIENDPEVESLLIKINSFI